MSLPSIIQGGMGIAVSNWQLARTVSKTGEMGVVSGTSINAVLVRRLQDGDTGGHVRRALSHFPVPYVAEEILRAYYLPEGRKDGLPYKPNIMSSFFPSLPLLKLTAAAAFVEVYLAKENHSGIVGINFLEKLQIANLAGLLGAMLAGVHYVLIGAGIPRETPGVLDLFAQMKPASIRIPITNAPEGFDDRFTFDPKAVFPTLTISELPRPKFLAIVSSATLASHLAKKASGRVDGFIIEGPTAGGHNAPPRGPLRLDAKGEPIYGEKDRPDLAEFRELGLPFWLAGSFGTPEGLAAAKAAGAAGIQVGTAFAFSQESGLDEKLRRQALDKWALGRSSDMIFTDPVASPTGFPFKVVPLAGTQSEESVYQARPRKCDLGYLRTAVYSEGKVIFRCPAEPVADYVKKGGNIEETVGRKCLCNALMADIGCGQIQPSGYHEVPLLTAGDEIIHLRRFLKPGQQSYSALDVIEYLRGPVVSKLMPERAVGTLI